MAAKKKVFVPPTQEDVVQYIADNPELSNVDPVTFWKGFNDGGWIDTQGKPVRNWKLKIRTWSNYGSQQKLSGGKTVRKTKLFPIPGRVCDVRGCPMPAVYKNAKTGYVYYRCSGHMPEQVKKEYD